MAVQSLQLDSDHSISFIGPSLEKGALPAIFYFGLSVKESLEIDPYNQPALALASYPVRIFSLDLPAHGLNLASVDALSAWAEEIKKEKDPLSPFFQKTCKIIELLCARKIVLKEKIGIMGLSRGCLIGCHVASQLPFIQYILGFAPLTKLSLSKEFQEISKVQQFDVQNLTSSLYNRTLRFYIGNRDVRVGTDLCYSWIRSLVEQAFENRIRSAPIELMITPSIGHMGHGTSKEIFEQGAKWLYDQLR